MKYWIIFGGVTEGPLTFEQLCMRGLPGQTPVWRSGLPDWTYLENLPEWQERDTVQTAVAEEAETPAGKVVIPPLPESPSRNDRPVSDHRNHPWTARPTIDKSKDAPTYLGWSIAATLVCCTVIGIVAIVYALRVRDENARGYYEEAHRDSRTLELWLMASIALGLVALPFNLIITML